MTSRRLGGLLLLGVLGSGCASAPEVDMVPPIDAAALVEVQTVGVVVPPTCLAAGELPHVVAGAGEGAGRGAGVGAVSGVSPLYFCTAGPIGCVVGIALSAVTVPVGAMVGTVAGAIAAKSPEEVDAAGAEIRRAVAEVDVVAALEARIIESGEALTPARFVSCSGKELCPALEPSELDALLDIRTLVLEFPASGAWSPDFTAVMSVDACVTKADGVELYAGRWRYRGRDADFFEVAADPARFRAELSRAVDAIGDAVVRDAFVARRRP